jgi:asparagine synthase (glutamine-hydrolysing)
MVRFAGFIGSGGQISSFAPNLSRSWKCPASDSVQSYRNDSLGIGFQWYSKETDTNCGLVWNDSRDVGALVFGDIIREKEWLGGPDSRRNPGFKFIELYEKGHPHFLEKINGRFHGLIIDLRAKCVLLFNDRYGLQRLYLTEQDGVTYFSSDARTLLRSFPKTESILPESLGEWISFSAVINYKSLFPGITLLSPASVWEFSPGSICNKRQYFHKASWENQPHLDESDFYNGLKSTFTRILPRYLEPKNSIGISLTGGLDGRMIMAWLPSESADVPCYTFVGPYRHCADAKIAKQIANATEHTHQLLPVGNRFLSEFPALASETIELSDGLMDITGAVELYANRLASDIAPIRLTGNYGSEIVRGNVAFRPTKYTSDVWESGLCKDIQQAAVAYQDEANCHPVSFIAFKQVPWYHYARFSIESSQLVPRSPFLDNDLVRLMYQAPRSALLSREPSLRLISEGNSKLAQIPTDRGVVYQPRPIVTRAQSLFQEFTARAEYAYDYGMPHWLARLDSLAAPLHLEKLFLGRHKFYHFRTWYRHELASYVKEMLLDQRSLSRPYLRRKHVEKIVGDHTTGRGNYTTEIHQLLTLELIHRHLLERN